MKIAIIADTHWGTRGDESVFHKFSKLFFNEIFFPTIDKMEVEHIIHLGDVFDKWKAVNIKTAAECRSSMIEPIVKRGIPMDVILGNHDTYFKDTNKINSVQEHMGNYELINLHKDPTEVMVGDDKFLYLPWINVENYHESLSMINTSDASMVFGHLEIGGFEMYRGKLCDKGMSRKLFDRFEAVFSGHFHKKSTSGAIRYTGSTGHYTWFDHGDDRGFHILDTNTRQVAFIRNPHDPFWTIEYDDSFLNLPEEDRPIGNYTFNPASARDRYIRIVVKHCQDEAFLKNLKDNLADWGAKSITEVDDRIKTKRDGLQSRPTGVKDVLELMRLRAREATAVPADTLVDRLESLYEEARKVI